MTREIKFRAKRVDNRQWSYGGLIQCDDFCIIDQHNELYVEEEYNFRGDTHFFKLSGVMCDKKTICQYTGLKDKNGVEIYEGDILGVDINGMNKKLIGWVEGGVRCYCYDVVYLNHPKGEERWSLYGTVIHDFPNRIEIIGNIHDNPELLKEN